MRHISKFLSCSRRSRVLLIAVLFVVGGFLIGQAVPVFAQAQGDFGVTAVDSQIALSGTSIAVIIVNVIRILLGSLGLVLVILIMYAGYMIMTSAGNEEKITKGKEILRNAVIGTAIILFSLIIVQFVLNILGGVSGNQQGQANPPGQVTFDGIGSLGTVIKDHYPQPGQTNVYRNTKIVVTFTESIDPSSIIENTNKSCWRDGMATTTACTLSDDPYYGDCVAGVCDTLKPGVIQVNRLAAKGGATEGNQMPLTAVVAYEKGTDAHTFVFKPKDGALFGNDTTDQWHRVVITDAVENANGDSIFRGRSSDSYTWEFETNTEVDLTPPYVVSISPEPGEVIPKNNALQITFNEAVDPMTVQGYFSSTSAFTNVVVDYQSGGNQSGDSSSGTTQQTTTGLSLADPTTLPYLDIAQKAYASAPLSGVASASIVWLYAEDNGTFYFARDVYLIKVLPDKTVQSFKAPHPILSVAMTNDRLYLGTLGGPDNNNPGVVSVISKNNLTAIGRKNGLLNPQNIVVHNGHVYIADGDASLKILSPAQDTTSSDISSMTVKTVNIGVRVSKLAMSQAVDGQPYLYVVVYDTSALGPSRNRIVALDISDPSSIPSTPSNLTSIGFGTNPLFLGVHTNTVDGKEYLYGAVRTDGLSVMSTIGSNQNTFAQLISVPITTGASSISLAFSGTNLIVGNKMSLQLYDVKDPRKPELLSTMPVSTNTNELNDSNSRAMAVVGEQVIVSNGVGLLLVNLRTTTSVQNAPGSFTGSDGVDLSGNWKITNGYRTIEFLTDESCGVNSCGEDIYCLPTGCPKEDKSCTAKYAVLARTASLLDDKGNSFVANAGTFDGVVDMADNALDNAPGLAGDGESSVVGKSDRKIFAFVNGADTWTHRPPQSATTYITSSQTNPDSFWWYFTVANTIDTRAPYIRQVSPGIDQESVVGGQLVDIYFSAKMLFDSLTTIQIEEYPPSTIGLGTRHSDVNNPPIAGGASVTSTKHTVEHPGRPFGIGGSDYYYFTTVPGSVKALNQFCLYPGRGPSAQEDADIGVSSVCAIAYNEDGEIVSDSDITNCTVPGKVVTPSTDTACVTVGTGVSSTVATTEECLGLIRNNTVSPTSPKTPQ